jgi:hypothetical protein
VDGESTTLILSGQLQTPYTPIAIEFTLPQLSPSKYEELVSLHDQTFDLVNDGVVVTIRENGIPMGAQILEGTLSFKRAQTLMVDGTLAQVILSGNFEAKVVIRNTPVTISNGRFDLGISKDAFFLIN